jgi:hypothetical protein
VGVYGEEVGARGVDAAEDEGRAYLALVSISQHCQLRLCIDQNGGSAIREKQARREGDG